MSPVQICLAVAAGVCAMSGFWFFLGHQRTSMTEGWTSTTGVVTDRDGNVHGGMPAYYPTFMYQDQHGTWHRRGSNVGASLQPRPGTQVPVKYDPERPDRAVMDTFSQSGRAFFMVGWIVLGVGLPLVAVALVVVQAVTEALP